MSETFNNASERNENTDCESERKKLWKPVTLVKHPSIYTNTSRGEQNTRFNPNRAYKLAFFFFNLRAPRLSQTTTEIIRFPRKKIIFGEHRNINNWRGVVLQIYWSFFSIAKSDFLLRSPRGSNLLASSSHFAELACCVSDFDLMLVRPVSTARGG